jgi:hypothetical protein
VKSLIGRGFLFIPALGKEYEWAELGGKNEKRFHLD